MEKNKREFLKVAIQAAQKAGEIQRRHLGKVRSIRFKGEINLVTEVDHACEKVILKTLKKSFSDHEFLTEETGFIQAEGKTPYRWIIDPLDGTTNYAHAYPCFCVSIGLEYRGKVIVGVVFNPNLDELFWSVVGEGAWLNRKRIHVSTTAKLKRSLLATGFAYHVDKTIDVDLRRFKNFLKNIQAVRRDGAAAIDLCYIACGRYDGFWETGLKPWDTAAATLILKEAGGKSTLFNGRPLDIYGDNIVASNGKLHRQMLRILR